MASPNLWSGFEIHRGLSIDNHKHLRDLQYVLAVDYFAEVERAEVVRGAQALVITNLKTEIERLREELHTALLGGHLNEAAAEIERLREELLVQKGCRYAAEKMGQQDIEKINRYATALHQIIEEDPYCPEDPEPDHKYANRMAQIARIALDEVGK